MENNLIPSNNEVIILPAQTESETIQAKRCSHLPSDKMAEDFFKVTTDSVKECVATVKDNRIIRKRIVESEINATSIDLNVQTAEYQRVVKKLNDPSLTPNERARYEKRAETVSDRIHGSTESHQEDMRKNSPPPQRKMPVWGWLGLLGLTGIGGFCGGRYYQSRH